MPMVSNIFHFLLFINFCKSEIKFYLCNPQFQGSLFLINCKTRGYKVHPHQISTEATIHIYVTLNV